MPVNSRGQRVNTSKSKIKKKKPVKKKPDTKVKKGKY